MQEVPLAARKHTGLVAIVDDGNYEYVSQFHWYPRICQTDNGRWTYAVTGQGTDCVSMHRLVLGDPGALTVDHINGDTLDNRCANLRAATRAQQMQNRQPNRAYKGVPVGSSFKGVFPTNSAERPWRTRIRVMGRRLNLGNHRTERAAAVAYNDAAKRHFRDYARLNSV